MTEITNDPGSADADDARRRVLDLIASYDTPAYAEELTRAIDAVARSPEPVARAAMLIDVSVLLAAGAVTYCTETIARDTGKALTRMDVLHTLDVLLGEFLAEERGDRDAEAS